MYIRATANISPQKTFGNVPFLTDAVEFTGDQLNCILPDYKDLIDPKLIRRMSRIIKMGVAVGLACNKEAGLAAPDAICAGTAYGCMEDTNAFLTKMVQQNEELLTPTAFIQSTHNTISAQTALLLHCHTYNNTFVNGGASFENALLDATMLLNEGEAGNVLVGGIDEIVPNSHQILRRMGLYRREATSNLRLLDTPSKGTMAGEGAAFFLLCNEASHNDYARLDGVTTFYKPAQLTAVEQQITNFVKYHHITINDIDLIITGKNGDIKNDEIYTQLQQTVFAGASIVNYKHLCGEYPTSSAFALWLAANIIKINAVPNVIANGLPAKPIKRVLIYNHYLHMHHSLMLLSAC
jgi:3-oxoacyl-[acyl-carrier-protein] synthase II